MHHIFLFYIPPGQEKVKGEDPLMNAVATFAPGMPAELYPDGYARLVPAGSRLVFQVHYTPSGTEQLDQSDVGSYFTDAERDYKEVSWQSSLMRGSPFRRAMRTMRSCRP